MQDKTKSWENAKAWSEPEAITGEHFKVLTDFLREGDETEPEVVGRGDFGPPQNMQKLLRAFAEGKLNTDQRAEVVALLRRNPEWVPFLAREVKTLRNAPNPNPGPPQEDK